MSVANKAPQALFKTPYEEVLFDFDFTNILEVGETISGTPTIDITPSGQVTVSNIVVSGAKVQGKYIGGTDNTKYIVKCKAVTSLQKHELVGDLYVRDIP